ncbi:ribonuclease H-like domain-containing protein [Bacillus xiapuensis]|uniref:Ribonuclease H-like domain-containing protein n=1 Tax=Bacillus xiapuensis TaxID=2014075 RepID=A0ABU6NBQ6_9BACI|nr:ribonuclease H-like domain-containing protein [Bacillus xiapuensis]
MSLKNKLNRLKPHISTGVQTEKNKDVQGNSFLEIPFREQWEKEKVFPYVLDQNYCLIREVKYPLSQQHGHYRFHDFLTAIEIWNKQSINHPLSAAGHRAEELFFFDTETTGLGGGVGNTIFLLGYASFTGKEIILRQHILPNPGAEVPLYHSFLEKINYKTLVTYNGKSFDWPQVKTRHTLVREHVPKLPPFGHFDLFHSARRLWKHKLDRLKLAVVEKEILGVERIDDIPGFLAPMIYFDFIESKQPDGMIGILKHNEMDILSLITLYTHLTFQICGVDPNRTRMETFEVGRWFASLGEKNEAKKELTKLVGGTDLPSEKAKLALALQLKKEQEWKRVVELLIETAKSEDDGIALQSYLELAKIYEHRIKDMEIARIYCIKAIDTVSQLQNHKKDTHPLSYYQLELRLKRLEKKLGKFPGEPQNSP